MHTLKVTAANVYDVATMARLLSGKEETVHGDSITLAPRSGKKPYCGITTVKRSGIKSVAVRPRQKNASARSRTQIKCREREKSSVRAKVEHVFAVAKGRF